MRCVNGVEQCELDYERRGLEVLVFVEERNKSEKVCLSSIGLMSRWSSEGRRTRTKDHIHTHIHFVIQQPTINRQHNREQTTTKRHA